MIATRMRKNTAPTEAPPPIRRATRHSRTNNAPQRVHAAIPAPPLEPQAARRVEPERRMGRRDDEAAAGEMLAHDFGE